MATTEDEAIDIMAEMQLSIMRPPKGLRAGQYAANRLNELRPDLYVRINGSEYDPYYNDKKIPAFLVWVAENA
jgi:hypothetical protein